MPGAYHTEGTAAVGTDKTIVSLISAATTRPQIVEMNFGCVAAPADAATRWAVQRFTADGTGTAFTPIASDPGAPASLTTSKAAYSAEPTVTANAFMWGMSLNQRNTYRYVQFVGAALMAPATAANGLSLKSRSSTVTTAHEVNCVFME